MKINTKNASAINKAIDAVQSSRCTSRTVNHEYVLQSIEQIEMRLVKLLPKKDWQGLRFFCEPHAQNFPSSYSGVPESTGYALERGASGWFMVDVVRGRCASAGHHIGPCNLHERADSIIAFVRNPINFRGL